MSEHVQVKPIDDDKPERLVDWWATHAVKALRRSQERIEALEQRVKALEKRLEEADGA